MGAKRILVVEDLPRVAQMIEQVLRSFVEHYGLELEVQVANDGASALAEMRRDPASLVISDIYMRGLDGLGLLRAIRADSSLAAVPVLIVTGGHSDERKRAMEAGANAFLEKPFRLPQLFESVATLLGLGPSLPPSSSS